MAKRIICLLLWLGIFVLLPFTVQAIDPPHDSSNGIVCQDCHFLVNQDGILQIIIPRGAEQETVCKKCHNPTGQASSMSNVSNHVVNEGNTIIDCGSCHDPHGPDTVLDPHTGIEAVNLKLIRNKARHVEGALDLAIFQQRPDHFAFYDSYAPWNGICQTCHTSTNHHTNDATADHTHEIGTNCTGCHTHENHFLPSGGTCSGCHSNPQDEAGVGPEGGRRAAAAEFPANNAHAHYGADLDGACLVCHSVDTHKDGYVELIDPDDSSIYRFMKPSDLASDPDLSNFCSGCHDADGAQRLASPLDPFGNGNTPPDVATRFLGTLQWDEWYGDFCFGEEGTLRRVNSHHDISDSDQALSGAKIECLNCHGAHNASADTPIADPSNQSLAWTGSMNDFCLSCHYGGIGPVPDPLAFDPDFPAQPIATDVIGPTIAMRGLDTGDCSYNDLPWWVNYTWTHSAHGPDSKRYWPGYPNLPNSDAVLNCTVCHDPHGSYTATNTLGNPYMIRDYVDGTPFIDDGNRPNPSTWTAVPGTAGNVVVAISGTSVDWGSTGSLCSKCHANWLAAYDWHSYCNGCQTCHGHGQSWDGSDWGTQGGNDTTCYEEESPAASSSSIGKAAFTEQRLHVYQGSSVHQPNEEQVCFICHEAHN
jgi:hypothetical protein